MMIIPVTGDRVELSRPLTDGAKIAVASIAIKTDAGFSSPDYKMTISLLQGGQWEETMVYTLGASEITTFRGFKIALFEAPIKIRDRRVIRGILSRITESSGKLYLKPGSHPTFRLEVNRGLSTALGLTFLSYTISDSGDLYPEEPSRGVIFFHNARTSLTRCPQVDLTKHLDNNLMTFNFKKYNERPEYKECDMLSFFSLTPGAHRILTFSCSPGISIVCLTLYILEK